MGVFYRFLKMSCFAKHWVFASGIFFSNGKNYVHNYSIVVKTTSVAWN